ncbi:hypothetical protein M0804_011422 [Polistes exclamans]|nr:hypothetical protein M0804_011422 [Polistes exclamans]
MSWDKSKFLNPETSNSRWLTDRQLVQFLYPGPENLEDEDDTVEPWWLQREKSIEQEDVNMEQENTIYENDPECFDLEIDENDTLEFSLLQGDESVSQEDVNMEQENTIYENYPECFDLEIDENDTSEFSWLQGDESITQEDVSIEQESIDYNDDLEYSDIEIDEKNIRELETLREKEYTFNVDNNSDIEIDENNIAELSKRKFQERRLVVPEEVVWENDSTSMKSFPFQNYDRMHDIVQESDPIRLFRLVLDDDLIDCIISNTNAYAADTLRCPEIRQYYRLTSWTEVTRSEILVLFGILLHMGTIKLDRVSDYWKKEQLFRLRVFTNNMSFKRFTLLLRMLHFGEQQSNEEGDQLRKIRNIIDYFNDKMSKIYYPEREIILDESLVFWRGKFIPRQYIPNKYEKYGVRIITVQTVTGFVLKCSMFTDILDDYDENENCEKVMKSLDKFLNIGHSVYSNNDYNSYELAKQLLKRRTYITGNIRKNRKTLPKKVVKAKLMKGESICKYADDVMIGKWKDTKDFTYISTEYKNDMVLIKNKRNETKLVPLPVKQRNENLRKRINNLEQLLFYYPLEKDIIRWPVKLFIHLLQLMVTNVHLIINQSFYGDVSLDSLRSYLINNMLIIPTKNLHTIMPLYTTDESTHVLTVLQKNKVIPLKKRKPCNNCNSSGIINFSCFVCNVCNGNPTFCEACVKITHAL